METIDKFLNVQIAYHNMMIKTHTHAVEDLLKLNNLSNTPFSESMLFNKLCDEHETDINSDSYSSININNTESDYVSNDPCDQLEAAIDDVVDGQDIIWDRIRKSQQQLKDAQLDNQPNETEKFLKNNLCENNELDTAHINSVETPPDVELGYTKPPTINKLFKYNKAQINKKIKDVFTQACVNMESHKHLYSTDEYDEKVQNEADRLLQVFLTIE